MPTGSRKTPRDKREKDPRQLALHILDTAVPDAEPCAFHKLAWYVYQRLVTGGSEFVIHDSENGETIRTLKLLDDARFSDDWSA